MTDPQPEDAALDDMDARLAKLGTRLDKLLEPEPPPPGKEFDGKGTIPLPEPDPEAERRLRKSITKHNSLFGY